MHQHPQVLTELPGPRARAEIARGAFDMQSIYRSVVIDDVASQGTIITDVDGNRFLDLFSSFALGALGYNHPRLLEVARSPAYVHASINPTSTPFMTSTTWFDLLQEMERHAPAGMAKVFCVDSGGEGVEAAMKAAFIVHGEARRRAAGQPVNPLEQAAELQQAWMENHGTDAVIVSFSGAFHGRGLGPMSATHSKVIHKADLPAFGWPTVPFPANRWPLEAHADENAALETASLAELERTLDAYAGRVAAVLVEPMQSEGGDRHASAAFFREVQRLAGAAGAALILDEVQTGMGISGTMWLHQQLDLPKPPELVTFGKKMQLGGFFAAPSHDIRQFGRMYQTRNGDRARLMLGVATMQAIVGDGLLDRVREVGAAFLAGLQALERRRPRLVSEARGRGFLLAFDMPDVKTRDAILAAALRRGVFATYTGARSVRLRPHLITGHAEVELALSVFDDVLAEMDV